MSKKPSDPQGPAPTDAAEDEVPAALAPLFERARGKLIGRLQILHETLGQVERDALTTKTLDEAKREAHKLAGSLGTYGLGSGSVAAREIELRLDERDPVRIEGAWLRTRVEHIERLLHQVRTSDLKEGSSGTPAEPRATSNTLDPVKSRPHSPPLQTPPSGEIAGSALDRLVDTWLDALADVEEATADLVRQAGGRTEAGKPRPGPRTGRDVDLQAARRTLQRSIGSMEAIGLDALVALAREVVALIPDDVHPQDPAGTRVPRLAERLFQLQQGLEQSRAPAGEATALVWVVSGDEGWAQHVSAALETDGSQARIVQDARLLSKILAQHDGTLGVVLDASVAKPADLDRLRPVMGDLPTILALSSPTLANRVTAGRAGVDRVVDRSRPPHEIATIFAGLEHQRHTVTGRILVVDDDATILAMVEATLQGAGFDVVALDGPDHFWQALETHTPDLIVTDLDMPETDGADLCLALRTDPRWENLPVVFLSAQQDAPQLRRVFDSGADDLVPKPVAPATLLTRVRARLRRHQARGVTSHLDPLTRLPMGKSFQDSVERAVAVAGTEKRPFTVAVVALNEGPRLRERVGGSALERLQYTVARRLAGLTGAGGLVGRLELDRFLVAFPGLDRHDARPIVEEALSGLRGQEPGTKETALVASAGLAQLGHHGSTLAGLVAAAQEARDTAEDQGVVVYTAGGGKRGPLEPVDVLVVDDDETIGMLLQEALGQKGWRVRWEQDSKRVVERLSGEQADLRAKVVLLDVNMPGMDGLTVLRLLAQRGVVPPARVVMLTVRAREDEVIRALELGAMDHVAKPFSVPVLVSRLERAMEA